MRLAYVEEKQVFKSSNSVEGKYVTHSNIETCDIQPILCALRNYCTMSIIVELDDKLARQRILKENGKYNIAILPATWDDKLSISTVVSTHRTAYIKWTDGK